MILGAIFDLDGTLFDSMGVWQKIDQDFLEGRGLPFSEYDLDEINSKSFEEVAKYTIEKFNLPDTVDMLMAEWNAMAIEEYSHNIMLKTHAKDYLLALKASKIKLATATSLPNVLCDPLLKNNGIYGLFDVFCSTSEVKNGKEHPDIYLLAAEKLGLPPENCVVFEDILPGVNSAKRAGMLVYGVYDSYAESCAEEIKKVANGYLMDFSNAPLVFMET